VAGGSSLLPASQLGTGEPLVLINGYAASRADWDPAFVAALAARSTVIAPDSPGIGESPPIDGELTVASMADDVLAMMDARGIRSADVVGWSMGGFIAQELAARASQRVRGLALLSTDPGGPRAVRAPPEVWDRLVDHSGRCSDGTRSRLTHVENILAPTLIAAGTEDAVIPAVNSQLLADALAGPSHFLFEGGGHAFMAQEPEGLAGAINDWFGR
jgi:pimeloyl-ACP methyl ester carboxylesterase